MSEKTIDFYIERHRLTTTQIHELRSFNNSGCSISPNTQQVSVSIVQCAELLRLSRLFRENLIEFISLKGPLLSWRLYRHAFQRYSNDLDILVSVNNLESALKLMETVGYHPLYNNYPEKPVLRRLILRTDNHICLINRQNGVMTEVHWRLMKQGHSLSVSIENIARQYKEEITFKGESFLVFKKEFELVFLIIHGACHAWFRLKWLHDVVAFSRDNSLDWELVLEIAFKLNCVHLVYQAIQLSEIYWELPPEILQKFKNHFLKSNSILIRYPVYAISTDAGNLTFYTWIKKIFNMLRYQLALFPSISYKLSCFTGYFFKESDVQKFKLPDSLTYLYFILRPFLWLISKVSGKK